VLRLRKACPGPLQRKRQAMRGRCAWCWTTAASCPLPGKLLFSDLTVDAGTGQVTLRAEVPNPQGLLLPGQYVRVRLAQATLPARCAAAAAGGDAQRQGDTVLVVGEDNKPAPRPVKVAGSQGGQLGRHRRPAGRRPGDRRRLPEDVRPGAPVTPVPWTPAGAAAAGAPRRRRGPFAPVASR
jgi:membrane fusion protein (multidrug efflux system)